MAAKILKVFCFAVLGFAWMAVNSEAAEFFKNYGEIRPSAEATGVFENYKILPDYRYYVSGPDLYPNALIALDRAYALDSDLWKERKLTSAEMKELIGDMQSKALVVGETLHGYDILNNGGKKIGLWYSILRARTYVKMEGDGRVVIATPPIDLWERGGDGRLFQVPR
jgi:hypothetical protein